MPQKESKTKEVAIRKGGQNQAEKAAKLFISSRDLSMGVPFHGHPWDSEEIVT